jgi:hypothetical protein
MRWPSKETRERWEFVFKGSQALAVVIGVFWAAGTFFDTRYRELRKPYEEKKLQIYTDTARVLAGLSSNASEGKEEAKRRFWELYLGELPFVESDPVKGWMVEFCQHHRDQIGGDCNKGAEAAHDAVCMAKVASAEVRRAWAEKPWYVRIYEWVFPERADSECTMPLPQAPTAPPAQPK